MLMDPKKQKEPERWFSFLTKAKRHMNAESGVLLFVFGGVLYVAMPLGFVLGPVPMAVGAGLLMSAMTKSAKQRLRERKRIKAARRRPEVIDSKDRKALPEASDDDQS